MLGHMLLVTFVYNFILNDFNTYWYASLIFAGLIYGFCSRLLLVIVLRWSAAGGQGAGSMSLSDKVLVKPWKREEVLRWVEQLRGVAQMRRSVEEMNAKLGKPQ